MRLVLFNSAEPTIKLNKTNMTQVGSTNASPDPTGPVSKTDPVFICDKDTVPMSANYLYCEEYGRYYFIVDITYSIAKTATITCHVDLLNTYKNRISETVFNFVRGASDINEVEDTSYPIGDYVRTITWPLEGWNNNFLKNEAGNSARHYVLRVAAGAEAQGGEDVFLSVGQYFILTDASGTNLFRVDLDSSLTPPAPSITWIQASASTAYQWIDGQDIVEILDSTSASLGQYKFMNQGQFAYIVRVN